MLLGIRVARELLVRLDLVAGAEEANADAPVEPASGRPSLTLSVAGLIRARKVLNETALRAVASRP